jgi:hypothetical protein
MHNQPDVFITRQNLERLPQSGVNGPHQCYLFLLTVLSPNFNKYTWNDSSLSKYVFFGSKR